MKSPYGLPVIESCLSCPLQRSSFFCALPEQAKRDLAALSHSAVYPAQAVLTVEGQSPRGIFIVCSGQVKVSNTSRDGKSITIRIAHPGEVIGLSAVLSGAPYATTSETLMPTQVRYVAADAFTRLAHKHGEIALQVTRTLSTELYDACQEIRTLALARSCASRLASLLLSWCPSGGADRKNTELRIKSGFTHEQMAEMIGTSRETVTRVLSEFKRDQILQVDGSTLVVRNLSALESLAA